MKLYNITHNKIHFTAYELPTLEKAYKKQYKLRKKRYSTPDAPQAFDKRNGQRVYIVYAKKDKVIDQIDKHSEKEKRIYIRAIKKCVPLKIRIPLYLDIKKICREQKEDFHKVYIWNLIDSTGTTYFELYHRLFKD